MTPKAGARRTYPNNLVGNTIWNVPQYFVMELLLKTLSVIIKTDFTYMYTFFYYVSIYWRYMCMAIYTVSQKNWARVLCLITLTDIELYE